MCCLSMKKMTAAATKLSDFSDLNDLQAKKDLNSWNKSNKHLSSNFWNRNRESGEQQSEFKKSKSANNSTLSLHIAAYENSVEDKTDSNGSKRDDSKSKSEKTALIKKWNTSKQGFIDSLLFIQNPFEFPRQQEDEDNYDPEVMQFKASQRLLNPNEEHLNFEENRIVPFLEQVNRLPSTDEQDILLQQSELNFDESANTFTPPQPNHLASSIHISQHPVHDAIEDLKLAMPENEDVNEKESLLAGTSFSASPTFASINMTNEFWKFHFNILSENGHDYNGKQRGLVGLYNQGNSCYMNAATQALSNCPPLREYFLSYLPSVSKDRNAHIHDLLTIRRPISDAFQDLILKMWSEKKLDAIRPTFLLYKIKDRCAQFKGYTQQDAQEFIRCFLDVLHQELRYPINHIMDEKNKRDEKQLESRNSVSSSCSSSQDELNGAQGDRFETADSGLSSDTGEPSKKSKLTAGIPLSVSPEKPKAAKKREQKGQEKNQTQFRSIITDVFDGEIISTVKCMTCQHLSNTRETFQDISLSIPTLEQIAILRESSSLDFEASGEEMKKEKEEEEMEEPDVEDTQSMKHESSFALRLSHNSYAFWAYALAKSWLIDPWLSYLIYFYRFMFAENISLEDCLYAFFSADHLHGDDMYSCEKCSKLRNGVKQCRLTRLPEILCIHLKRFRHEYTYNTKVGTRVIFPLCDLDMKPFMLKSALEQAEQEDKSTLYDLVAFVSHRGAGVEFGHYVAYCYNSVDGNWYEYDDACVSKVDEADVLSREAYVLFYQKRSTDASENFKARVLELSAIMNETNSEAFYISAEWLYRFRTFSEPGPITNSDFLCEHFGQAPLLQPNQVFPIPSKIWSLLFEQYGGGPPCDRLMPCNTCNNRVLDIISRKTREKKAFNLLGKRLRYVTVLPPNVIAYSWYEQWDCFVTHFDRAAPGPIRNDALLQKQRDGSMRLRSGINYKSITREQWTYLHSIYGGGPEVLLTYDKQPCAEEIHSIVQRFEEQLAAVERKVKEPIVELPSSDNEEEDSKLIKEEEDSRIEEQETKSCSSMILIPDLKHEKSSEDVTIAVNANTE